MTTRAQAIAFTGGYYIWGATILCLVATLTYIVVGASVTKKFSVAEPLHIWCICIWLAAAAGQVMVIRGYDVIADNGGEFSELNSWENLNVIGVFLVNLSYISIFSFSFAYYRASTLLQMQN